MNQYGKITATAMYVPEKCVTNDELAQIMDTSDEWIQSRTGIKERHVVAEENTSDLCLKVAAQLLADSNYGPETIDFIIVATMTPDFVTPAVACQVQGQLGATNAMAFDISAACSGFVYALALGEKLIRGGARKGIVIGGETLSKVVDWQDRSTAVLFGDGAGGVLLEAADEPYLLAEKLQADGSRGMSLTSSYRENNSPFYTKEETANPYLTMVGRDIFDFAIRDVPANIRQLLTETDMELADVDYFLLHQANGRMIDKIARKLKVPREQFFTNMDKYGNTSAASIPILLDESVKSGKLTLGSNQKVVLTGFGGGLTWGSVLYTL